MTVERAIGDAAAVPFAMAAVVVAVTLARLPAAGRDAPRELVAGVRLALEFLLAAGLLRLAAIEDAAALAVVAAVVLLRRLLTTGLGFGLRALRTGRATAG